ncbi:GntR family transcriptional regulator [Brenneria uluponensis]|uniref:GntR family transcriptional regulator n=1 Tax=Brenneria uluponensis TaxID=3057057 RepID=UPI0028E315F9|nr:GntR family transcriptional regulator [Brenneria ulupoensis]
MSMISPIAQRPTKRSEVGERLREAILSGFLKPGVKLVESQIAKDFGISRAPLREAISALVEEGLIINEPFGGYYIQTLSEQSLRDLYGMRRVLETFAFETIWHKRTQMFCDDLLRRNEALKTCIRSGDKAKAIKAELSLHGAVFERCGNALLLNVWRGLSGQLQLYWSMHQESHGRAGAKLDAHEEYVALACGDDFELMRSEISEHVQRGLEKVVTSLEAHTDSVNQP